jgi:isoleucyl-tRNA synthetase
MSTIKYNNLATLHLPTIEKLVGQSWQTNNTFQQSINIRNGMPTYVFYEGPPSANGLPGIHHVISRAIKDLFCRYKTMQGFQVQRKAGWDTHGLPVELGVEKELGITKEDIGIKITVEEYNKKCREVVMRYRDLWSDITQKMGYWVNLEDPYVTYENKYVETLWWCLKELHTKNLLYKSVSIQPYSPAAGTGLSSHELNQPGCYKNVKDTSATVLFELDDAKNSHHPTDKIITDAISNNLENLPAEKQDCKVGFLAWTTTPWTLPSNLGLTVGANIPYVLVKTFNPYTHQLQYVILADALVAKYFKPEGANIPLADYAPDSKIIPYQVITMFKGDLLEGLRYQQLLSFNSNKLDSIDGDPLKVICGDFVTTADGTGIVHTAPAFGADDYRVGQKNNLGIVTLVDKEGKFIAGTGEYAGRYVKNYKDDAEYKDVNVDICIALKTSGNAFKVEKYEHSYPHCWRTDKPIIYYPLDAWFIKTSAAKDRMVQLNNTINWKPKSTGEGRFGKWLENMVDWNLSRSRYWGTPLPIWRTADGTQEKCIGTITELNAEIEKANAVLQNVNTNYLHDNALDLHKPFVDDITLVTEDGQAMHREPDLIDVWFDSGAMPYAQWGVDFAEKLKAGDADAWTKFPADFIAEGVDQTRGWFYTLHALGVMLFDNVAYKTVVSNGLVLDKNGQKMSKRLGNVVDPFTTIDKYSADATRWYLVSNASPWDSVKFDMAGIEEVQRKFFGTLFNTYSFYCLYANVDGFTYKEDKIDVADRPEIDRWIISKLNSLVADVTTYFDEYEPTKAARAIQEFVDAHVSNWHVRLSRKRFWRGEYEHDKIAAYQTLYECLVTIAKLMAPIAPFFADWLYTNLNQISKQESAISVHLANFPKANSTDIDTELEHQMHLAQEVCSLVLSLRKKEKHKVRQPLQKIMIPVLNDTMQSQLQHVANLIKTETNIKEIQFVTEAESTISKKIQPNFKMLGAKLGAKMKDAALVIKAFDQQQINELEKNKEISIVVNGENIIITIAEVEIMANDIAGWSVATNNDITVALDITLTIDLINEGLAREIINKIQGIRKDSGLEVTDRIVVKMCETSQLITPLQQFKVYICAEILADDFEIVPEIQNGTQIEVNEILTTILITKQ